MRPTILLLSFICLLFACEQDPADQTSDDTLTSDSIPDIPSAQERSLTFKVALDYLRLRKTPGENGEQVAMLNEGDVVEEMGEVSDFTTRIKLRGVWYEEPWVKVRTQDGKEGWVFAGGLSFDPNAANALSQQLLELRLQSFFGPALTKRIQQYRKDYHAASNSETFAQVYRNGGALRDTMATILEKKIDVPALENGKLPDLFWITEGMPGYQTALVAEGTIYYLFKDYKQWQKMAGRTSGKEDDDYVQMLLQVHALDSVEYFFPAWMIQTWDYGGHSLLGQGKHLQILQTASQNLKRSPLFLDETLRIKNQIIEDITRKNNTYWERKSKILEELDAIIASESSILTKEDKIALETRRKQFENPAGNGLEINKKAGG